MIKYFYSRLKYWIRRKLGKVNNNQSSLNMIIDLIPTIFVTAAIMGSIAEFKKREDLNKCKPFTINKIGWQWMFICK